MSLLFIIDQESVHRRVTDRAISSATLKTAPVIFPLSALGTHGRDCCSVEAWRSGIVKGGHNRRLE